MIKKLFNNVRFVREASIIIVYHKAKPTSYKVEVIELEYATSILASRS